jgi:hypothetical protein
MAFSRSEKSQRETICRRSAGLAKAFLNRLVERAIILKVTGKSYRAWLAQQAAKVESRKERVGVKTAGLPYALQDHRGTQSEVLNCGSDRRGFES